MTKSEFIKSLRSELGKSQKAFAKENGLPTITIQSWERGVREPKLEKCIALAKKYGKDYSVLL